MKSSTLKSIYYTSTLLLLLTVSCSQRLSYTEAIQKNTKKFDSQDKIDDANFLVEVKSLTDLVSRLTKLAADSAYASTLSALSKKHLNEHNNVVEEIEKLAKKTKVKLPSELSERHQQTYNRIAYQDRQDFDRSYIEAVKLLHKESESRFSTMATEASNGDIRAFTARRLGVIRNHIKEIEDVEKKLLNTY